MSKHPGIAPSRGQASRDLGPGLGPTVVAGLVAIGLVAVCGVVGSWPGGIQDAGRAPSGSPLGTCAQLAAEGSSPAVAGLDGWWFPRAELRHLGAGVFWGDAARSVGRAANVELRDPLPAIIDLAERLSKRGIALLVVPVPPKAVIYPDKVSQTLAALVGHGRDAERLDVHHVALYQLLHERGIEVLDLVPALRAARAHGGEPLYCRTDAHWSPAGCELAADSIAGWIKRRFADEPWLAEHPRTRYETATEQLRLSGDLVRGLDPETNPRCEESVTIRHVGTRAGDRLEPVAPDRQSPVLVMADSHGLVFHSGGDLFASGAGLPDQLALELGFPVDLIAVRGSAASATRTTLLRRSSDPTYLDQKRVVVWCFAARELTESVSGWSLVPLERPSARSGSR